MTTRMEKPVRRLVDIGGVPYVVEISRAGVLFRQANKRSRAAAPWRSVLHMAERLAGEDAQREARRLEVLRRIGGGRQ